MYSLCNHNQLVGENEMKYTRSCMFILFSIYFNPAHQQLINFDLRFYNTNGSKNVYAKWSISYLTAVNLCKEICEQYWWCSALRKCADRPRLFHCDVLCKWRKLDTGKDESDITTCVHNQVSLIGPNVAANKTVGLVRNSTRYPYLLPKYGTDSITLCPRNELFVHTLRARNPWIKIYLGEIKDVGLVVVYNRQLTNAHRFKNAGIYLIENGRSTQCGFYKGPGISDQIIFVLCNKPARADIVWIITYVNDYLNVCEVEVYEMA